MEIAYTAHTETCTLLLDGEGICRSVLAASSAAVANGHGNRSSRIPASAERCIGAQYVATLDVHEPGGMVPLPKPGAQMLFARTEPTGRVTLIRSATVVRFEHTPARQSGVHERPELDYGDDEEHTIQELEAPTLVADRRASSLPPPPAPARSSGVVQAGARVDRTAIPPPPPPARVEESNTRPVYTPPPYSPRASQVYPPPPPPASYPTRPSASYPPRPSASYPHRPSTSLSPRPSQPTAPSIVALRPPRPSSVPSPKRPSLVRVSVPDLELDTDTRPYRRASR
jgi:hypothetical protein